MRRLARWATCGGRKAVVRVSEEHGRDPRGSFALSPEPVRITRIPSPTNESVLEQPR